MALIILKQILVMSIYMLIGYLLYKSGKITNRKKADVNRRKGVCLLPG